MRNKKFFSFPIELLQEALEPAQMLLRIAQYGFWVLERKKGFTHYEAEEWLGFCLQYTDYPEKRFSSYIEHQPRMSIGVCVLLRWVKEYRMNHYGEDEWFYFRVVLALRSYPNNSAGVKTNKTELANRMSGYYCSSKYVGDPKILERLNDRYAWRKLKKLIERNEHIRFSTSNHRGFVFVLDKTNNN